MFDTLDAEPRGFSGRPLAALLFAVGLGIVASRFHANDFTAFAMILTVTALIWERLKAEQ
jgi:hypothetical protein